MKELLFPSRRPLWCWLLFFFNIVPLRQLSQQWPLSSGNYILLDLYDTCVRQFALIFLPLIRFWFLCGTILIPIEVLFWTSFILVIGASRLLLSNEASQLSSVSLSATEDSSPFCCKGNRGRILCNPSTCFFLPLLYYSLLYYLYFTTDCTNVFV